MSQRFPHFLQLDDWRGISIIFVLIGHSLAYSLCLTEPFNQIDEFASLGVLCFFILSGFLITGLLLEEEEATGRVSLTRFYWRRVLRIIPAYYFMILVIGILMLLKCVTDVPWSTVIICLLFLRDIAGQSITLGHTWSLSLEEQFYLIWPAILGKLPAKHRSLTIFSACICLEIWRFLAITLNFWQPQNTFRPDFRFDCILVGCLLALLHQQNKGMLCALSRKIGFPFFIALLLLLWTLFAGKIAGTLAIYLTVQLWLAAILFCQLIVADNSRFIKVLSHPILVWFGKISYSLYLWQQLFIATKVPSWGMLRTFPFDLLCALIVSCFSYHLIERPFLRLKKKFLSPSQLL